MIKKICESWISWIWLRIACIEPKYNIQEPKSLILISFFLFYFLRFDSIFLYKWKDLIQWNEMLYSAVIQDFENVDTTKKTVGEIGLI